MTQPQNHQPHILYTDDPAVTVSLVRLIAQGGEASVCNIDRAGMAAKLWRQSIQTQVEKVRAMLRIRTPTDSAAWPTTLLYNDPERTIPVGYLMPLFDDSRWLPIFNYYNPIARAAKSIPPNAPDNGVIAANLAREIQYLHDHRIIIADFNPKNILADQRGKIRLLDTDSWQITEPDGHRHPATAWTPETCAPETLELIRHPAQCHRPACPTDSGHHQTAIGCIDLARDHDNFGLAVTIFRLLHEGTHPYNRVAQQGTEPPNEQAARIQEQHFPHSPNHPVKCCYGPAQQHWQRLPGSLRQLFQQAFA